MAVYLCSSPSALQDDALTRWTDGSSFAALVPALLELQPLRLPPRPRLGGDLIPLASHLVFGGPLAALDTAELVVDLAAGYCGGNDDDHCAEQHEMIAKTAPITP